MAEPTNNETEGTGPSRRRVAFDADTDVLEPPPVPETSTEEPTEDSDPLAFLDQAQTALQDQITKRPYTTIAVALAAGYVLGGGVPWWAVRSAVNIGGRMAVTRLIGAAIEQV